MVRLFKKMEGFYKVAVIIADLVLVNLAYVLAFLLKFGGELPDYNFVPYMQAMPFITIAALIYFDIYGLLKFYAKTVYDALVSVLIVVALLAITTVAITYFRQGFSFPRSVLLIAPVFQVVLLGVWKIFLLRIRRYIVGIKNVMIIGDIREPNLTIEKVKMSMRGDNANVKYIFDPREVEGILKRLGDVEEIFICADVPEDLKMKIISKCIGEKQVIYVIPQIFEISLLNSRLVQFSDIPAFMIGKLDLSIEQKFFKRCFDIVSSIIGIVLLFPLMLITAFAIRFSSSGPVIYSQERVTKDNRVFRVYKFRTMYNDAEQRTGPVLSVLNDPRITPLGRLLRKVRLDEIPQLFNVLKGEMSIVGPRPERPYFVEQFCKTIPDYSRRNVVRSGITGFAQVLGRYDTTPEDKLRYDLTYIKNYSLMLDMKLIFQTVKVAFSSNKIHDQGTYKIYKQDTCLKDIKTLIK